MIVASAVCLFLWYRTVVSLPVARQPDFIAVPAFKWGVPALALLLFLGGVYLAALVGAMIAVAAGLVALALSAAAIRFDRYTAAMKLIHDRYRRIREHNPGMLEPEVLYHVAEWRYPRYSEDRLVELVAGKSIESLLLLMVIQDNKINPISDWE